jgi:hypothetical protein
LIVLAIFGLALSRVRRSDVALGPALSWVFATGGWLVGALSILVLGLLAVSATFPPGCAAVCWTCWQRMAQRHNFSKESTA